MESIDEFNSFSPMQVIATATETSALVKSRGTAPFLLFPEDRTRAIRMRRDLPASWAAPGAAGASPAPPCAASGTPSR